MPDWTAIEEACGTFDPDWAHHPGGTLADWLAEHDVPPGDFAEAAGWSAPFVSMLTAGTKNVGVGVALRLESTTEHFDSRVRAEVWLHLQMIHDLWHARRDPARYG